jgi:sec-independent protein translocase protein TatC
VRGLTLIGTAVTEAFFTKMKVAFVAAIIVALPVLLWQGWQFVAPGLYEHEKRYTRSFVFFGSLFFLAGAVFCYDVVLQLGLGFLLRRYEAIGVQPLIHIGDYLSLISRLVLAFGVMFELPVLAYFLSRVGIIDHRFLIRHIRYAVIGIAVLAAILTPPDFISQALLMIPLSLLYAVGIVVAYFARKPEEEEG